MTDWRIQHVADLAPAVMFLATLAAWSLSLIASALWCGVILGLWDRWRDG